MNERRERTISIGIRLQAYGVFGELPRSRVYVQVKRDL